jgi:photosystem II stability/assembly factor-like uncharacterized protein
MAIARSSRLLVLMLIGVVTLLAGDQATTISAVADDGDPEWAVLGPLGPGYIESLAVDTGWPGEPFIMATWTADDPGRPPEHEPKLIRTRDGGQTWEPLPDPSLTLSQRSLTSAIRSLKVVKAPAGRVILAMLRGRGPAPSPASPAAPVLLRSTDDGDTWQAALEGGTLGGLWISPNSADDGLVIAQIDGRPYQSQDAGATWAPLDSVPMQPGQRLGALAFSPSFAKDRTIYLAVVTGDVASSGPSQRVVAGILPPDNSLLSLGLLVSHDAGESWTVSNAGLEVDGAPYHWIEDLAISPTFERDGTLFATSYGPYAVVSRQLAVAPRAVFRSRDRGQTWQVITTHSGYASFAISPSFADDGVVLRGDSTYGETPASAACNVLRSADGGDTWTQVVTPGQYESCHSLSLVDAGPTGLGVVLRTYWEFSVDGGKTWNSRFGTKKMTGISAVVPVKTAEGRPAYLFGARAGGIWLWGRGVTSTGGMLPCSTVVAVRFSHAYQSDLESQVHLGCPVGPEEPVSAQLGERLGYNHRPEHLIRFDGDASKWLILGLGGDMWLTPGDQNVPDPISDVTGSLQRFDGGMMLSLNLPDSDARTVLVLGRSGWYRELPEAGSP